MRSHSQIVRDFGATALTRALAQRGRVLHASTTQRWADRNSIPGPFWADLAALEVATLEELAHSAANDAETASSEAA